MADQWYYRLFGEEFGPVPVETLKSLLEIGTIGASDDVRQEGASDWTTAGQAFATAETSTVGTATATAPASIDDGDQWYCQLLGQELGPLSFEDLLKFAEQGELSAEDDVKLGAAGKWRKVGSIGRLVSVLPYRESQELRPAQIVEVKPANARAEATPPQTAPIPAATVSPRATGPTYHPAAEENSWYAWIQGTEYGPVNLLELSQWLTTGRLGPADMVKQGMLSQWMPSAAVAQALSRLILNPATVPVPTVAARTASPPAAPAPTVSTPRPPVTAPAPKSDPPVSRATPPITQPAGDAPKPGTATTSAAESVIQRMAAAESRIHSPTPSESPARPASTSVGGRGFGGSSSSIPSAWSAPSKPAARPAKSSPSRPPTDWGAMLGPLKDAKTLGVIGVIVVVVFVFFGSSLLPASTGADRKKLEQLQQILADFRKNREDRVGPAEWEAFTKKAEEIRKPIADELEKTANRKFPARQYLLWASRNRLPEMLQSNREKPGLAEEQFEANLYDAAKLLGVAKGDPPKASNAARVEAPPSEEQNTEE